MTTLLLLAVSTACSGGGSNSGARRGGLPEGPLPDTLTIRTQWPAADARHVNTDATIVVSFDGTLAAASLTDGQTWLEERATGKILDTHIRLGGDGESLLIQPAHTLATETWYTVHLSPTLADVTERLLEEDLAFSFETVDVTAPKLVASTLANGQTNVEPNVAVQVEFDDELDPDQVRSSTVYFRGPSGEHPAETTVRGKTIRVQPIKDLLPATDYTLHLRGGAQGLRDLGGNTLPADITRAFKTRADTAPRAMQIDVGAGELSPHASLFVTFDSTIDVATAAGAFDLLGPTGNFAVSVDADPTGRVLRVTSNIKLSSGKTYTLRVNKGTLRNQAGTALANTLAADFRISTDEQAPRLQRSEPENQANRVSFNVKPTLDFDEQLDLRRLNNETVSLRDDSGELPFTITTGANAARIVIDPTVPFETGKRYALKLRGGPFGIRDLVGNTIAKDLEIVFYTSTDQTAPSVVISPTHGHSAASTNTKFTAAFDEPLDPGTVNASTVVVLDDSRNVVSGKIELSGGNRIVSFTATRPYTPGAWYDVTLRAGQNGIRELTGNWLTKPITTSFRVAYGKDTTPPDVTVTLNNIADRRKGALAVPASGFELTILADDPINYDMDLSSFDIEITGEAATLTSNEILRTARITKDGIHYTVPLSQKFAPGDYTLRARAKDMAGNETTSEPLAFRVVNGDAGVMPFERAQVVWVRFDLDRDGNGRADFEDDLYRLGLIAEGDPAGTNQRMIDLMRDGVLAITHDMFERKTNGGRKDTGSMPILFTAYEPRGITFAEMAIGGLDPQAPRGRKYGDKSSGILGRAWFDHLNGNRAEKNTATNPGLGVFGGELFLFEAETHRQLYPMFLTSFGKRFMKVSPPMGGTAAGNHFLDKKVLDPGFDPDGASAQERARYFDVFLAADDWAAAIAVILAHETGHMIGLVGSGAPPAGQHGDASLHNRYASLGDVMSSAVGYESLITLRYRFRDLNAAYLRQQVLLK